MIVCTLNLKNGVGWNKNTKLSCKNCVSCAITQIWSVATLSLIYYSFFKLLPQQGLTSMAFSFGIVWHQPITLQALWTMYRPKKYIFPLCIWIQNYEMCIFKIWGKCYKFIHHLLFTDGSNKSYSNQNCNPVCSWFIN